MSQDSGRAPRVLRMLHHAIFHASRDGRSKEIVGWANAVASVALGAGVFSRLGAWPAALVTALALFVLLRLALAHRTTVWVAAAFGTVAVAGVAGGLAWVFAHVLESVPAAPEVGAVIGVVAAAIPVATAYLRVARQRASWRDSLFDPISVRSSGA